MVDLSCSRCSAVVGEEHKAFSGLRLYKANVSLLRKPKDGINSDHDVWETYPVDMIVGTQLLDLVERVGARRFAVHSAEYTDTSSRDNKIGLLVSLLAYPHLLILPSPVVNSLNLISKDNLHMNRDLNDPLIHSNT